MSCGLIWKPLLVAFTEGKDVIDMHRVYSMNNVYKPKINTLATFDKVRFYLSKWGIFNACTLMFLNSNETL